MTNRSSCIVLLAAAGVVLFGSSPSTAQVFVLQGEQGPVGETPIDCTGLGCTVDQNLVVQGALEIETGTFSGDLTISGSAYAGAVDVESLSVTGRYELPGCPEGYQLNVGDVCELEISPGVYDEMVAVGDFWIDRYEMSIWNQETCTGSQFGAGVDNYDSAQFYEDGNWDSELYACSLADESPSLAMTWYQAQQACALAGKSLCTSAQWQAAVAGTPDDTTCNIDHGGVEDTGSNPGCISAWGAMDLVGNLSEWVADWQGHVGNNGVPNTYNIEYGEDAYFSGGPWPASMLDGGVSGSWRALSGAIDGGGDGQGEHFGPAATSRGGSWGSGEAAGAFYLYLQTGPSFGGSDLGARCCVQR